MKMKKSFGVNVQWCIFYDEEGRDKEYKKESMWVALNLLFCAAWNKILSSLGLTKVPSLSLLKN